MNISKLKKLIIFMIVLVCIVQSTSVYASEIDATLQTVANSAYLSDLCSQANMVSGVQVLSYEAGTGILRFNNRLYSILDASVKKDFMETALTYVSKIPDNASAKMKNSVYNFISKQDTAVTSAMKYLQINAGADLVEAEKWFSHISPIISTILGVMSLLVFMFLGFSVMFDIFYIVIPPFQAMLNMSGESNKRPWGVSKEAWSAVSEAEKTDEYKNVLSIYFRRRTGVIIVVAIAITYMVSGKIYDLVVWLVEAFNW